MGHPSFVLLLQGSQQERDIVQPRSANMTSEGAESTRIVESAVKRRADCLYLPRHDGNGDIEIEVSCAYF
jgi:hypothetical protein